jgi:lipopolysaccharide transport system ATP-binding protein
MNSKSEPVSGAIRLQNVSKHFKLYRSPVHRLTDMAFRRETHENCRAVSDISLSINPGEAVGLMGVNGSGKSTLLHIIAGTRIATSGEASVGGRISSLLELGVGFHPEWTARENVQFYLRLRNVGQASILDLIEQIQEFADIGSYFDQPMRSSSSGMVMRVAFAAAALVEADILIVDEALAVGDAVFQHKCFQHFEMLRAAGVTLLFVTHQPSLIAQICSRALILDKGRLVFDGEPREAAERYIALATQNAVGTDVSTKSSNEVRFGSGSAIATKRGRNRLPR